MAEIQIAVFTEDGQGSDVSCSVYRAFDKDGALLYVGATTNPHRRLAQHRYESPWFDAFVKITSETFPSRMDAERAEMLAIKSEKPRYNKQHNTRPSQIKPQDVVFIRQFMGKTQDEFAKMLGLTRGHIAKIEGGRQLIDGATSTAIKAITLLGDPKAWPDCIQITQGDEKDDTKNV